MRAYRISRRWIVALGVAGLGLAWGCGGLLPPELVYDLHVDPILPEGRGDYTIDLEDSAMVFSHEGLRRQDRLAVLNVEAENPLRLKQLR